MRSPFAAGAAVIVVFLAFIAFLLVGAEAPPSPGSTAQPLVSATARASTAPAPPATTPAAAERDPETGLRWVEAGRLPTEAQQLITVIDRGGPFRYPEDGASFRNRERLLPSHPLGYYREYTVRTPGEGDRGARRVVTGDGGRQLFYTGDHYASFVRIRR